MLSQIKRFIKVQLHVMDEMRFYRIKSHFIEQRLNILTGP